MRRVYMVLVLALWSAGLGAATFTVTTSGDSGPGSLRQAIVDANANAGADVINFAIAGTPSITLASALPQVTDTVLIDAQTQPGFAGAPIVEINGNALFITCLNVTTSATGSTIRGFVINRCADRALALSGSSHVVEGNYIGTNTAGTAALANRGAISR